MLFGEVTIEIWWVKKEKVSSLYRLYVGDILLNQSILGGGQFIFTIKRHYLSILFTLHLDQVKEK